MLILNNNWPRLTFPSTQGISTTSCSTNNNVFLSPIKTNNIPLTKTTKFPPSPTFSTPQLEKKRNKVLLKQNIKREFTIDGLLLKEENNKKIKKEENVVVDYFMEEGQLSLTDGRRNYSPPLSKSSSPPLLLQQQKLPPSKHVCTECGKSYATSSNLSRHKQTHRPIDSPHARRCPYCEKPYVSMPAFAMHILTHQAKHKCPKCGKLFSRPWLLKGHLRSHTGQKPFGCGNCGKAFSDRSNLRAHLNTHNAEKRWNCAHCGRGFVLKSYLNKHLEQQHGDSNLVNNEEEE
uniref:C2H2-type domain-containing protein n=1 Tax=Meloidogyne floridensis TaxID=298350 RepID=A0A915NGX6_9BILA